MNIIASTAELKPGTRPVCLAIGVFDGVHLGHQAIIQQATNEARRHNARSVVITFDRHPSEIVAPERAVALIYPLAKKMGVIASLGPETACVIRFDTAFSQVSGEKFIRDIARASGQIQSISVGDGFVFGWKRTGDVALLQTLGKELNFAVHALAEVTLGGQPVSSTRVREAVRAGDFSRATEMLGRPYALCGPVVHGARLGHKLGTPTANLGVTGLVTPPAGVYAATAQALGKTWRAAVNIGHRPTVASATPQLRVEAHLLDFDADIYGQDIELVFEKRLRDEKKFPSLEALRAQIAKDVTQARRI